VRWRGAAPYILIAPAVIYLLTLQAYPLLEGGRLSLTDTSLLQPGAGDFVGLANYLEIASSASFWRVLRVTLVYTVVSVLGALGLGMSAALLMNKPFRGRAFVRGAVTIPWAAPQVASALIFIWMFNNQYGVFNYFLTALGVQERYGRWLDNPDRALIAILIVTIWMIFPITALVLLAALQSIPEELYEASRIDGADPLNVFRNVTIPGIAPTLLVITLFLTIWSLRRFEIIWLLTQGGPGGATGTLVVDLYREAFRLTNLGYAAALGMAGVLLSTLATAAFFGLSRRLNRKGILA
jgi:multiple sugar transport system permease protein